MIDYTRDDVIEALEYLLSPVCTETQFDYCNEIRAAIAFLKEQESRVLDWNEIGTVDGAVWLEDRDENEVVPGLVMQMHSAVNLDIKKDGKLRTASASRSDYGDRWRAWSARPTEEQRKAVKWND